MAFTLDEVVPFGRSRREYGRMFDLSPVDLEGAILGCADGPASFNAEMARQGRHVISCDPLYALAPEQIARRIEATFDTVIEGARVNADRYVWQEIESPGRLAAVRRAAMRTFLADLPHGGRAGRYVAAALPKLPFANRQFDLALCSHFLFTYTAQLSETFHVAAVLEMLRVAREVRVFPLLDLAGSPSAHLEPVRDALQRQGFGVTVRPVPYEFQRGGNRMLQVVAAPKR